MITKDVGEREKKGGRAIWSVPIDRETRISFFFSLFLLLSQIKTPRVFVVGSSNFVWRIEEDPPSKFKLGNETLFDGYGTSDSLATGRSLRTCRCGGVLVTARVNNTQLLRFSI